MFTEVLAGQEQLRLAEENEQLAQRVVNTVAKRVQAGKVPPSRKPGPAVALSTTRIAMVQAQRELEPARKRLALFWEHSRPAVQLALGNLESVVVLPSFEVLAERALCQSYGPLRAMKNVEERKALLEVEYYTNVYRILPLTPACSPTRNLGATLQ